jgi:hypothetical protein
VAVGAEEAFKRGSVRVMAEPFAFPVWCSDRSTQRAVGTNLDEPLRNRLIAWNKDFTDHAMADDDWPGLAAWVEQGRRLATEVRAVAPDEVRVFYFVDSGDEDTPDEWVEITA